MKITILQFVKIKTRRYKSTIDFGIFHLSKNMHKNLINIPSILSSNMTISYSVSCEAS